VGAESKDLLMHSFQVLCQGTTSVVPQMGQNEVWALAPEETPNVWIAICVGKAKKDEILHKN
jgi:hypothetical protein